MSCIFVQWTHYYISLKGVGQKWLNSETERDFVPSFDLSGCDVTITGVSGAYINFLSSINFLSLVDAFRPDVGLIHLGGNDLSRVGRHAANLAYKVQQSVEMLRDKYIVGRIIVHNELPRTKLYEVDYNSRLTQFNMFLSVTLADTDRACFWTMPRYPLSCPGAFLSDGVHFDHVGLVKYYRSIRGAILASVRFLYGHDHI